MNVTFAPSITLLPLAIPAIAACLLLIASLDKDQATMKWVRGSMFAIALLALMGSFFYITRLWGAGAQPQYAQITLDRLAQFTAILVLVTAAMAVLQLWDHLHHEGWVKGETLPLLLFSVTGMLLFASTTNLILLFLSLELMSLPLYALTATIRMRAVAPEGGVKYFLTGSVASACFLMGAVLVYGTTGKLDCALMANASGTLDPLLLTGVALLVMGFLFKVSAVPFHQWTPDAYEAAPHPVAGFMSVATKGVALVALLRVFPIHLAPTHLLAGKIQLAIGLFAALSIILGNLAAIAQTSVKRMLAYSSIAHAGYLLLAFVAGTGQAFAGLLYYLIAYMAMNMGAFGLLSAMGLPGDKTDFRELRGYGWKRPDLGIAVTLCMLSLAGIPPTAGFFGKYMIFKELLQQGHVSLAVVGVLGSLVSVYFYMRVVVALFMEQPTEAQIREAAERPEVSAPCAGATVFISGVLVIVGGLMASRLVETFAARAVLDGISRLH